MVMQLNSLVKLYDIILHSLQMQQEDDKIQGQLPSYHEQFMRFLTFQRLQWKKLIEIQEQKPKSL